MPARRLPRLASRASERLCCIAWLAAGWVPAAWAAAGSSAETFLWIALILIAAKLAALVERFKQPAVLGELLLGIVLGNLSWVGWDFMEPVKRDPILAFLGDLGVVILLFQIGLESDIASLRRVGARAFWVAVIGVAAPFLLGAYAAGPLLLPGLPRTAYLFLGAALTATSVGITGRVFRDFGIVQAPAARTVLGAAVIDDVLGLMILAVVTSIATEGAVSGAQIGRLVLEASSFLVGALVLGQIVAPRLTRLFAWAHSGIGMKFTLLIGFCLVFAFLAHRMGLAPIIGAFAAGLILKPVHFAYFDDPTINDDVRKAVEGADEKTRVSVDQVLEKHAHQHLEHMIEPVGHFFVPVFFVLTGMQVDLEALLEPETLLLALALTAVAVAGKLVAGLAAGRGNGWLVGWGMVPRGEVGLIFAVTGKTLGVVPEALFSAVVVVVILTTLLTPPVLARLVAGKTLRG